MFTSCSALVSDFSSLKDSSFPETIIETNIEQKIAQKETAKPKTEKLADEQKDVEEKPVEFYEETIEKTETEKEITIEETSDIPEAIEENSEIEESTIIETIEEVIIENDILKISKKDDTYFIKTEFIGASFTKDYVVKNERFIWIEENKSCVLVINGELVFLDYYNYSEIFLER